MYDVKIRISEQDREPLDFFLFESGEEHSWIVFDDVKTREMSIQAVFETKGEAIAAWESLKPRLGDPQEPAFGNVHDSDWKDSYKEHFKPWSIGELHWVPLWLKDEYDMPKENEAVYLDPGMAFGTGNHGTTRLCVEQLIGYKESHPDFMDARIVDAGCGSGILALSALKIGFRNSRGFDIDEDAVRIARENAACNGAPDANLEVGGLEEGLGESCADCLMANILAVVLVEHARKLVDSVAPGGWLILSGILREEAENVRARFSDTGAVSEGTITYLDEWACVRFSKLPEA